MKKIESLAFILLVAFVVPLWAGQPTTTRAKESSVGGSRYRSVLNSFTSTTSLDTVIVLDSNDKAFSTEDNEVSRTIFQIQFQTAETTASQSDWDVLWQVSGVNDAAATTLTATSILNDFTTVETDEFDNNLSWVATFDAAAYKGCKVRALLSEANADSDAAVAIEAYIIYPRK